MDLRRRLGERRALGIGVAGVVPPAPAPEAPEAPEALRMQGGAEPTATGDARPTRSPLPPPRAPSPVDAPHRARLDRLRVMLDAMVARQQASLKKPADARAPIAALEVDAPHAGATRVERDDAKRPRSLTPEGLTPTRAALLRSGPLPGDRWTSPHGPLHRVHRTLEPDHAHGRVPVAGALTVAPALIAKLCLDPSLAALEPSRFLYLDTETTGLQGGTGTLPFLVGLARFEDGVLVVEQLLLRSPADEGVMLRVLAERLAEASAIVTYNGKSYDWPLLKSRFVMNRLPPPEPPPHVDLLHAARRVLRPRLGEVRLVTLEQDLLRFRREHDIEGHEIPTVYWATVRGWDASMLTPIVEHNFHDLVALAAILATLVDRFEHLRREDDPLDHLGLAKVAARADDYPRATAFAEAAATGGGANGVVAEARTLAARLARQRGDAREAERQLLQGLATLPPRVPAARALHLTLSKLYEHRLKDPRAALHHAELADATEPEAERTRRLERLLARVTKLDAPPRARRARPNPRAPRDADAPASAPEPPDRALATAR